MCRASGSVAHVMPPSSDTVHSSYLNRHRIRGTALRSGVGYRLIERNRLTSNRNIIGAFVCRRYSGGVTMTTRAVRPVGRDGPVTKTR